MKQSIQTLFLFFITLTCLPLLSANASLTSAQKAQIDKRYGMFVLGLLAPTKTNKAETANDGPQTCGPVPSSAECVTFVAGWNPTLDQRIQAATSCAGNSGAQCATDVAGWNPTFEQRIAAAKSCRGNISNDCEKFVAGWNPTFDQRVAAANACQFADSACANQVAGWNPTLDQRVAAARACGGQN